jgi:hypothetical protein
MTGENALVDRIGPGGTCITCDDIGRYNYLYQI